MGEIIAADTFYVDRTAGDDANAGTSESAPFKTIGAAITAMGLASGSCVTRLRRGQTFDPSSITTAGTRDWSFEAYGGGPAPTVTGQATSHVFNWTTAVSGWTFRDLRFSHDESGYGVFRVSGLSGQMSNLTWEQCLFEDCASPIWESGGASGSGSVVRNCSFVRSANDDVSITGSSVEVDRCYFKDTGRTSTAGGVGDALTAHGTGAIDAHDVIADGSHRVFYALNSSADHALRSFHAALDHQSGEIHAAPYAIANDSGTGTLRLYNGTVVLDGTQKSWILYTGGNAASEIDASHCTFINRSSFTIANPSAAAVAVNILALMTLRSCISVVANSAVHGFTTGGTYTGESNRFSAGSWYNGAAARTLAQWQSDSGSDSTSTQGAVGLYDETGNRLEDHMLTDSSACRGAGQDFTSTYTTDYAGRDRPAASDIGALQYAPIPRVGAS